MPERSARRECPKGVPEISARKECPKGVPENSARKKCPKGVPYLRCGQFRPTTAELPHKRSVTCLPQRVAQARDAPIESTAVALAKNA